MYINLSRYIEIDNVLPIYKDDVEGIIIHRDDDSYLFVNTKNARCEEIPQLISIPDSKIFPRKGDEKIPWSQIPTIAFEEDELCVYISSNKFTQVVRYIRCIDTGRSIAHVANLFNNECITVNINSLCKLNSTCIEQHIEYLKLSGI